MGRRLYDKRNHRLYEEHLPDQVCVAHHTLRLNTFLINTICPSHEASSEVRLAEQPSAPPPPSTAPPGRARGQSTPGSSLPLPAMARRPPPPPRTRRLRTPSDSSEASVVLVATSAGARRRTQRRPRRVCSRRAARSTTSRSTTRSQMSSTLMTTMTDERKWDGPIQLQYKSTKSLMMLMTDYALVTDKSFREYAKKYAEDQDAFFKDFSSAFSKLLELGVPASNFATKERMFLKTLEEQQEAAKASK